MNWVLDIVFWMLSVAACSTGAPGQSACASLLQTRCDRGDTQGCIQYGAQIQKQCEQGSQDACSTVGLPGTIAPVTMMNQTIAPQSSLVPLLTDTAPPVNNTGGGLTPLATVSGSPAR